MASELVLAIETSCDETAVAIADGRGYPLVSRIASQVAIHAPYGGVVPELASRNHSADLRPLIELALTEVGATMGDIALVAATSGPGLASSLLIGDTTAKALAVGLGCPFYSINHMEGHLLSPFIRLEREVENHVGAGGKQPPGGAGVRQVGGNSFNIERCRDFGGFVQISQDQRRDPLPVQVVGAGQGLP